MRLPVPARSKAAAPPAAPPAMRTPFAAHSPAFTQPGPAGSDEEELCPLHLFGSALAGKRGRRTAAQGAAAVRQSYPEEPGASRKTAPASNAAQRRRGAEDTAAAVQYGAAQLVADSFVDDGSRRMAFQQQRRSTVEARENLKRSRCP